MRFLRRDYLVLFGSSIHCFRFLRQVRRHYLSWTKNHLEFVHVPVLAAVDAVVAVLVAGLAVEDCLVVVVAVVAGDADVVVAVVFVAVLFQIPLDVK